MLESFRIITNNPAVVEKNYAENEYYDGCSEIISDGCR